MFGELDMRDHAGDTFLGQGIDRAAFVYDDMSVVKIARFDGTEKANAKEIAFWMSIQSTDDARHFAAILEWTDDCTWIRQERIVETLNAYVDRVYGYTYDSLGWRDYHQTVEKLPEVEPIFAIAARLRVEDMHTENIGRRADGTFCIIDYGRNRTPVPAELIAVTERRCPCGCDDAVVGE